MKKLYILLLIPFLNISCETDFVNPNAAAENEILSSTEGLLGLAVGIQQRYISGGASPLYANITASGLSTKELTVLNAGNTEIAQLENGGNNVSSDNGVIINLWTGLHLTISDAQDLIENANTISDNKLSASVEAYGLLFKALALGTVAQYWEQGIINVVKFENGENATFSSRNELLKTAISLLENATNLAPSISDAFYDDDAVGDNIDIANAALALLARYKLMTGDYQGAITNANLVDLTKKSEFLFDNVITNPVYRSSLVTQNVYDATRDGNMGLPTSLSIDPINDKRFSFYLRKDSSTGEHFATGFFTSDEDPIPLYLPGEMMLIKAEAHARLDELTEAVAELNKVLTKKASDDAFGVGADLPAYSGSLTKTAILDEIYKNRAIELYMGGLRLEDSRRFGRPGPGEANSERTRNFYPYPKPEVDNNPNTPNNPSS